MKKSLILFALISIFIAASAQETGSFKDLRDGKVYKTVRIGSQTWFAENLAYKTKEESFSYNDDESFVPEFGRLYKFESAKVACPDGWHLPSDEDWKVLTDNLGNADGAGGKLKATAGWESPNTGATNESGFTALPAGSRYHSDGSYNNMGDHANFWSSTQYDCQTAWFFYVTYNRNKIYRNRLRNTSGFSVRCLKN